MGIPPPPPAFTATAASCRDHARRSGISLSINLPVATAPAQVAHTNAWAAQLNAQGDGIVSLASLHPDCENRSALIAEIAAAGFRGIKFHPEYQTFRFNEPRMDEVWFAMSDYGLVAYLHAVRYIGLSVFQCHCGQPRMSARMRLLLQQRGEERVRSYRDIYSFANIIRRMPQTPSQILPYLLFDIFYRKFGRVTERVCNWFSYRGIGVPARRLSYRIG